MVKHYVIVLEPKKSFVMQNENIHIGSILNLGEKPLELNITEFSSCDFNLHYNYNGLFIQYFFSEYIIVEGGERIESK